MLLAVVSTAENQLIYMRGTIHPVTTFSYTDISGTHADYTYCRTSRTAARSRLTVVKTAPGTVLISILVFKSQDPRYDRGTGSTYLSILRLLT